MTENASVGAALQAIKKAEAAGVDTSELVSRFNSIVSLAQQVEHSDVKSCVSNDDCRYDVDTELALITHDSAVAAYYEEGSLFVDFLTKLILSALGALAVSFGGLSCHRLWKSYESKRMMNAEITECKDRNL